VHIETRDKISAAEVCELLRNAPGVELVDGVETGAYPTAVTEASGNDPVYVGRVREDISHPRGIDLWVVADNPRGIDLWVVADNIRKGAALNSVQIAEILAKNYL
jgi:aspartate-semialdehyde dehydrogenase